jgi:hypothetical protein
MQKALAFLLILIFTQIDSFGQVFRLREVEGIQYHVPTPIKNGFIVIIMHGNHPLPVMSNTRYSITVRMLDTNFAVVKERSLFSGKFRVTDAYIVSINERVYLLFRERITKDTDSLCAMELDQVSLKEAPVKKITEILADLKLNIIPQPDPNRVLLEATSAWKEKKKLILRHFLLDESLKVLWDVDTDLELLGEDYSDKVTLLANDKIYFGYCDKMAKGWVFVRSTDKNELKRFEVNLKGMNVSWRKLFLLQNPVDRKLVVCGGYSMNHLKGIFWGELDKEDPSLQITMVPFPVEFTDAALQAREVHKKWGAGLPCEVQAVMGNDGKLHLIVSPHTWSAAVIRDIQITKDTIIYSSIYRADNFQAYDRNSYIYQYTEQYHIPYKNKLITIYNDDIRNNDLDPEGKIHVWPKAKNIMALSAAIVDEKGKVSKQVLHNYGGHISRGIYPKEILKLNDSTYVLFKDKDTKMLTISE